MRELPKRIVGLAKAAVAFAAAVALAVIVAGRYGLYEGQRPIDLGVDDGHLKPPSSTPNSVSSQAARWPGEGAAYARIDPIAFDGDAPAAILRLQRVVSGMPGARIVQSAPNYLYAEFTTPLLRFVDDVEFLVVPAAHVIHVRSASRLGRRDLGANRKRVEEIRRLFNAAEGPGGGPPALAAPVPEPTRSTPEPLGPLPAGN